MGREGRKQEAGTARRQGSGFRKGKKQEAGSRYRHTNQGH
jgi:hypothetical protein